MSPDGTLDALFPDAMIAVGRLVTAVALQPDGKVLIGGNFDAVQGVSRHGIARLNADAGLDSTFEEQMSGVRAEGGAESIRSIVLQEDGRVLIGGSFVRVNDVGRNSIARLHGEISVAPQITKQPSDQTSYLDCCAVLRVTATGTPRDYRWRKNGVQLMDGGNVTGAATATLTLTGVSTSDEGAFSVVVSNARGTETSNEVGLTVAEVPDCRLATCDPLLGCLLSAAPDGASCDDGDACTSDTCTGGVCSGTPTVPAEVDSDVRLARIGGETVIGWNLASGATSSAVLRGVTLPVGSLAGEEFCLASDLPSDTLEWPDAAIPAMGAGFWYLVRGDNACGHGPYGYQTRNGAPMIPRVSSTCP